MARITIDIDESPSASSKGAQGPSIAVSGAQDMSGVPAEIAAKAAASGANNAGPAPSLDSLTSAAAPVPFVANQAASVSPADATSAGAAPEQLYGSPTT